MKSVVWLVVLISLTAIYAAIPLGIPLNLQQLNKIIESKEKIKDIRNNYFTDRKYYSSLPPIVELTINQENEILRHFGHFFSEQPPVVLSSFVFNGSEITEGDPVAHGVEVCPSTARYEDVQFTVNGDNEVLQMIQMETAGQWVLDEFCDSPSGNIVGTICIERERTVNALVINLETNNTTNEYIKVFCCSAQIV